MKTALQTATKTVPIRHWYPQQRRKQHINDPRKQPRKRHWKWHGNKRKTVRKRCGNGTESGTENGTENGTETERKTPPIMTSKTASWATLKNGPQNGPPKNRAFTCEWGNKRHRATCVQLNGESQATLSLAALRSAHPYCTHQVQSASCYFNSTYYLMDQNWNFKKHLLEYITTH